MKTSLIQTGTVLALSLIGLLGVGITGVAGAVGEPAEEMILEGKKPARFNHATHTAQGMACGVCHHDQNHAPLTSEAIGAVTDPATLRCVSCHNDQMPKQELRQAKDIFHARCKTCHQDGYQGKKGPTKCTDCHLKSDKKAVEGC
ncbi:MAG: hypothetical protein C4563_01270 [Desulfobulbus sp.]|nr:MAG: hypothetical protein C4563_01270 [Desulfobulbus sp.]